MKKMLITICLLIGMLMMQGCCTVMSGKTQDIPVTSTPSGATIITAEGLSITTPGVLRLKRNTVHTLTAEKSGYSTQSKALKRKLNGWLWADIFWDFGLITGSIDFMTGAAYKLEPETVHFNLYKNILINKKEGLVLQEKILLDGKTVQFYSR